MTALDDPAPSAAARVTLDSVLGPAAGVYAVEIEGERVLYDESHDSLHLLDSIASVVWPLLDGTTPLRETCGELADAFGVEVARVEGDVLALAQRLVDELVLAPKAGGDVDDR